MGNPKNMTTEDPLLAPPTSAPQAPLLRDEHPPLRPSLLEVSPVSRRMENLDALRILCMLVIILTHVTEPFIDWQHKRSEPFGPLGLAILALNVMGRFGVPCFMMISFFIYWHQLYEKGRSWGELLARRLKRLVPAFLCWSAFYFLLHRRLYKLYGNAEWYNPLAEFKFSIFNWRTWRGLALGQAEYHLYYLPLVMQCLLLIPLLRLLWRKPVISWTWIGLTTAAWIVMVYGPVFSPVDSPAYQLSLRFTKLMNQPWAIPFIFFPLFGMMCAGQIEWRRFLAHSSTGFWIALLLLGLALHAAEAIFLMKRIPHDLPRIVALTKVGRILTGFSVFALFIRSPLMRDPYPRVSHYAFGLHFMHPFIIIMISFVELKFLGPSIAHFQSWVIPVLAINLLLTFYITFALCLLIGRFKRLEFLVV
jgi:hypothetical protein